MISNFRSTFLGMALAIVILLHASVAQAELAYSFEGNPPPDGFAGNGGGVTVTQDTIGTTDGSNSMKVDIVAGASFIALASNVAGHRSTGRAGHPAGPDD